MTTTLILARHGETDANKRLVFQGQTGAGLNGRGRAQAERLAARLSKNPPAAIFVSDLERAVETATVIGNACGLTPTTDPELREVDLGLWSGKTHTEIKELYPEEWAAWNAGLDMRRGGGETFAELAARIDRAVVRICESHEGGRVVLVSHGGSIKSWISKLLGVSPDGRLALAGVGNCSMTIVLRDRSTRCRLETWNDTSHLEGLVVAENTD